MKLFSRKRVRKLLRYFIMFLTIFILSQSIPQCNVDYLVSCNIAMIGAVTFAMIDLCFPILPL